MQPLITDIPLIGGVQVYFLSSPDIDFDLGGIANALDAPGLSNIIRKIILEQIGNFIVSKPPKLNDFWILKNYLALFLFIMENSSFRTSLAQAWVAILRMEDDIL